jgi:hypothetical protein
MRRKYDGRALKHHENSALDRANGEDGGRKANGLVKKQSSRFVHVRFAPIAEGAAVMYSRAHIGRRPIGYYER